MKGFGTMQHLEQSTTAYRKVNSQHARECIATSHSLRAMMICHHAKRLLMLLASKVRSYVGVLDDLAAIR